MAIDSKCSISDWTRVKCSWSVSAYDGKDRKKPVKEEAAENFSQRSAHK